MPRNRTVLQNKFPYHIGNRCINKDWFQLPIDKIWKIFSEELYMASIIHNLKIHSFVLMNNHYHLIASTPDKNLDVCMQRFSQRTSIRITKTGQRINQTFAGRYFKTILHSPNYYLSCYKYIYRNPVKAGICDSVEDYRYSSLHQKLGRSSLSFPILFDDTLFDPSFEPCLKWLNKTPTEKQNKSVEYALRRTHFKHLKCRSSRKLIVSDDEHI